MFRSSDHATSEPLEFTYKPNSYNRVKRKRSNDDTIIPTVIQPYESNTGNASSLNQSTFSSQYSPNLHHTFDINQNTHHQQDREQRQHEQDFELNIMLTTFDVEHLVSDFDESIFDQNSALGLAIDAPKSVNRDYSLDVNFTILEKLKLIMRLFKEQYDDDKIREMMMVLIKSADERDENLLMDVMQYGSKNDMKDLVLILVKYKLFDVFKYSKNEIDQNALHLAINLGYTSLVKVFIKFQVDVNETDAFGISPLHLAVQRNNRAIVEELLNHSKEIVMDDFDDNGNTPLLTSVLNNNLEISKILINHGANVMKKNPTNGFTCLHVALLNENVNKELIEHLISSDKALLTVENNEGFNPMELAVENKLPSDIIDLLSSNYDSNKGELLDESCIQELCEIFDKNDNWKIWVIRMDMTEHIKDWVNLESPTKALLQYLIVSFSISINYILCLECILHIIINSFINCCCVIISKEYEENFT